MIESIKTNEDYKMILNNNPPYRVVNDIINIIKKSNYDTYPRLYVIKYGLMNLVLAAVNTNYNNVSIDLYNLFSGYLYGDNSIVHYDIRHLIACVFYDFKCDKILVESYDSYISEILDGMFTTDKNKFNDHDCYNILLSKDIKNNDIFNYYSDLFAYSKDDEER